MKRLAAASLLLLAAAPAAADEWVFSETTSPLDYSPVIIASIHSMARADAVPLQLSIQCRRGRTDLVLASAALTGPTWEYRVSYAVDSGPPVAVPTRSGPGTAAIAIGGDVVRLLASLPANGELVFRARSLKGPAEEGRYALAPLKSILGRLAVPCGWPEAPGAPAGRPH